MWLCPCACPALPCLPWTLELPLTAPPPTPLPARPPPRPLQEFAAGREGLLERLFPRLQCLKCISTGSMGKYMPLLRQLTPSVPILSPCYCATEGSFGVSAPLLEAAASAGACAGGEAAAPAGEAGKAPGSPRSVLAPGGPAAAAAGKETGWQRFYHGAADQAPYVLCPNNRVFMEFLPLGAEPEAGNLLR